MPPRFSAGRRHVFGRAYSPPRLGLDRPVESRNSPRFPYRHHDDGRCTHEDSHRKRSLSEFSSHSVTTACGPRSIVSRPLSFSRFQKPPQAPRGGRLALDITESGRRKGRGFPEEPLLVIVIRASSSAEYESPGRRAKSRRANFTGLNTGDGLRSRPHRVRQIPRPK